MEMQRAARAGVAVSFLLSIPSSYARKKLSFLVELKPGSSAPRRVVGKSHVAVEEAKHGQGSLARVAGLWMYLIRLQSSWECGWTCFPHKYEHKIRGR